MFKKAKKFQSRFELGGLHCNCIHAYSPTCNKCDNILVSFHVHFSPATTVNVHCNKTCQNGGTLDAGTCVCNCTDGFSGSNCESEYTKESSGPLRLIRYIFYHAVLIFACSSLIKLYY